MGEEAAKCQFRHKHLPGYRCPHPAEVEQPGIGRVCVFHWDPETESSKERKKKKFNECLTQLIGEFEKKSKEEQKENPLDCQGFIFPEEFSFFEKKNPIPPVCLSYAEFSGYTSFSGSCFHENTSFEGTVFADHVTFHEATFGECVSFAGTHFKGRTAFNNATFGRCSIFSGAIFYDGPTFDDATFAPGAKFIAAIFADGPNIASFERSEFEGTADFSRARIRGAFRISGKPESNEPSVFRKGNAVNFEWMNFDQPERVLFHSVNLGDASFLYTDTSKVNFVHVSWPKDKNGNISFPGRYESGRFERPHSFRTLEWLETLCQQLKLNYENKRNYAEAGEFHWAEMEYRRQRLWMNKERLPALMLGLYKLASGYGERIGKAATILMGIFVLTFFFQARLGIWHAPYAIPEKNDPPTECLFADEREYRTYQVPLVTNPKCAEPIKGYEVFGHAAKFTLLDITLQKPDEYVPATWQGRALSLLSRIFFPIQLGLLLVAIKRRFRR